MESTYEELSGLTGKTYRTIRKKLHGLKPVRQEGNKLLFDSTVALPLIYRDNRTHKRLNLEDERAKLAREQRKKLELQNAETEGDLVRVEQATELWARLVGAMKAKLLHIPSKLAPNVAFEDNTAVCQNILKNGVHEALRELHTDLSRIIKKRLEQPTD